MLLKNISYAIKIYSIKFFIYSFILLSFFFYKDLSYCNNLQITNAILKTANTTSHYRMIQFDVSWENSWRTSTASYNWDAVWVFIKYRVGTGEWMHATLSSTSLDHIAVSGSTVMPVSDGKGVFIYRSADGSGTFSLSGVQLRWNYGVDGVSDGASVEVSVIGIEMVYIPQGSFYAGDNATSTASFKAGSGDNNPWNITNENAINVTNATSGGYYYVSENNTSEDATGSVFTIPSSFPKGYGAIYCMKYEITQGQYADFLNLLTSTQATARHPNQNGNNRHSISSNGGVYLAGRPDRACNYLSWADGCAYSDWSGLRPMTELEYEKICRGSSQAAVSGEYAWGTTKITEATTISGAENGSENITNTGANCSYKNLNIKTYTGGDGGQGPLRVGIFARSGNTREQSGATYYGVMEMSGNLYERPVTIGNSTGRTYTGIHGDGSLNSDGSFNVNNWPGADALGAGFRGGEWVNDEHHQRVSARFDASAVEVGRGINFGFRCVRVAP